MKKLMAIIMALLFVMQAQADENTVIRTIDGEEMTLTSLTEEHDKVLLAFWCSRIGESVDDLAVIAEAAPEAFVLAISPTDGEDEIMRIRDEKALPFVMAHEETLWTEYVTTGLPTYVLLDATGVIALRNEKFRDAAEVLDFTGETVIPLADNEALTAALGSVATVRGAADETLWPFIVDKSGKVTPSNIGRPGTTAMLLAAFTACEGQFIAYDAATAFTAMPQALSVYLDGERIDTLSGSHEEASYVFEITGTGEHVLGFSYSTGAKGSGDSCVIANVRLTDMAGAEAILSRDPGYPRSLFGCECDFYPVNEDAEKVLLTDGSGKKETGYVLNDDEGIYSILIGDGIDPDEALVSSDTDGTEVSLTMLDYDEEGYLFEKAVDTRDTTGFDASRLTLRPLYDGTGMAEITFLAFRDREALERYAGENGLLWCEADGDRALVITLTDDTGREAAGVGISVNGTSLVTDSMGQALYIGSFPCTVTVTDVPEGLLIPGNSFTADEAGEMTILLDRE